MERFHHRSEPVFLDCLLRDLMWIGIVFIMSLHLLLFLSHVVPRALQVMSDPLASLFHWCYWLMDIFDVLVMK